MKSIAVVEDNADNRLLIEVLLEERYHVQLYEAGAGAIEGMRCIRPDLVLLDISLPGMDGVQVLAHMRADVRLADLPVVALTAHSMKGDRERFLTAGFDEYLTKPILDEDLLLGTIERLTGRWAP